MKKARLVHKSFFPDTFYGIICVGDFYCRYSFYCIVFNFCHLAGVFKKGDDA